jgi:polyphosphate kinase 2 (PPK2 family)
MAGGSRQSPPPLLHAAVARREERFEAIRNRKLHLPREGTVVLKLMLHASKEMQACRLLRRIDLIHEFFFKNRRTA